MADTYQLTVQGLIRKRAEIAGRAGELDDQLRQALIDLEHVDATLRLLDPDIQPDGIPARAPAVAYSAAKGQTTRAVLVMLRENGPMVTQDIARRVLEERGLSGGDKRLVRTIYSRVASALRKMRDRGHLKSVRRADNGAMEWWITG